MKNSRKMKSLIAALACLLIPLFAFAGDIVATGGWTRTIDSADLSSGPGSDLTPSYESASDATDLQVTAAANYRVDVRQNAGTWDASLTLYVRRTSTGTGSGSISGGTTYQEVTTSNLEFFTGNSNRNGIDAQYRVDGMSVGISPDTYQTTVSYTITDL
jgi:hypothetical protein